MAGREAESDTQGASNVPSCTSMYIYMLQGCSGSGQKLKAKGMSGLRCGAVEEIFEINGQFSEPRGSNVTGFVVSSSCRVLMLSRPLVVHMSFQT